MFVISLLAPLMVILFQIDPPFCFKLTPYSDDGVPGRSVRVLC